MRVNDTKLIGVVRAGPMGHGIAQVFAMADYSVTFRELPRRVDLTQGRGSCDE